ncbi:LuxR family transcriptional regulator [Streptomyces sp. NPDC047081]|uniref:helix-turn-helix transcriptional regulator n=1 Tax=Streptomyces sp. NPDC047081 TaxID=3154706 RepID=UPI0033F308DE
MPTEPPHPYPPVTSSVAPSPAHLLGRTADLSYFADMRERLTTEGTGIAVLLEGPAGVGKSALLDAAADSARACGIRVLHLAGVESEVALAYSGLHQLLFGLRDGFDRLPQGQRDVLERILSVARAGTPPERFAVSVAVLEALRRTADEGPVLVVIDDVQWIDPASSDVLEFLARRLRGLPVDVLAAVRAGTAHALDRQGLVRRRIETLDEESSAALLRSAHPGLAPGALDRLLLEAGGNPLALLELPTLLTRDQFTGQAPLPLSLPVDERLEALFAPRVRDLPAETLELLLVAALEGTGGLRTIWAAYPGGMEAADSALGPAEETGLVRVDPRSGLMVFRHPLVRSAIVRTSRPRQRRRAHRALARALSREPERQIGHLIAAALGPDAALAEDLERAGQEALRRGSGAVAVTALRRAAELSPEPALRDRRLAHAAFAAAQSGALDITAVLVSDDYWDQASPHDTARAAVAKVYSLLERDGDAAAAHRLLIRMIDGLRKAEQDTDDEEARTSARDVMAELQFLLALVAFYAQRTDLWRDVLGRAGEAPDHVRLCYTALDSPQERALEVHHRIREAFAALPHDVGPRPVTQLSIVSVYYDEASEYRDRWLKIARRSQEGGTFIHWSYGTILLGHEAFFAGRIAEAESLARDGMALAEELGYRLSGFRLASQLALTAAVRGDADTVASITRDILDWSTPRRLGLLQVSAWQARALLALGQRDYETAYHNCSLVSPPGTLPPLNPRAIWSVYDLVEAAVHTGRRADARAHVAMAQRAGLAELSPRLGMLTEAAAALAGPAEQADSSFRRALARRDVHAPFDRARVQLSYGRWLRTHTVDGAASMAGEQLSAALRTLEELDARLWAAAARAELDALAGTPAPRPLTDTGPLTSQELQIAQLAATGLSNKEIGAHLFISPRTVSTHLYNVFPKLGIRSRAALRDALHGISRP